MRVLVTGGCGFIGKGLCRALCERHFDVSVLDSLSTQVHGERPDLSWLGGQGISFVKGSVCDPEACETALKGVECVVHLAAETGTGQSMYELRRYFDTNVTGTATLLDSCAKAAVRKLVVASSRAVYGEGLWKCALCGPVAPAMRDENHPKSISWNPLCPRCGTPAASMLPTPETAALHPCSAYGLTKLVQEQLVELAQATTGMVSSVLRLFNVFGPGQSLKNPYTGVLGVFVNRARENKKLDLYEDGRISRDFVFIDDVVEAFMKAITLESPCRCNIGSGRAVTIDEIAKEIVRSCGSGSTAVLTGKTRLGDVRGLVADIDEARRILAWKPRVEFEKGLERFVSWALASEYEDRYEQSLSELASKGLYR